MASEIPFLDQLQYAMDSGAFTRMGKGSAMVGNPLGGILYGLGLPVMRKGQEHTIYGDAYNAAINAGQNPYDLYPWLQQRMGKGPQPSEENAAGGGLPSWWQEWRKAAGETGGLLG